MRIVIVGAGAIGSYVASRLGQAGDEVVLVHRTPRADPLVAVGIDGKSVHGRGVRRTAELDALRDVDVCLVAVKSADTARVAEVVAELVPAQAVVVSLQNGLRNGALLERWLGDRAVSGVVGFNVFVDDEGRSCQATSGKLYLGDAAGMRGRMLRRLAERLSSAGIKAQVRPDIGGVALGKLLLNLNNGVCAVTGLGIAASLADRDARWSYAQCVVEGLRVMRAAGLRPRRVAALPPGALAHGLMLPDVVVRMMSGALARVHPLARSSTLQDLDRGRLTEIDELSGAICTIAANAHSRAPLNELVTLIVHRHERTAMRGATPNYLTGGELRAQLEGKLAGGGPGTTLARSRIHESPRHYVPHAMRDR